MAEEEAADAPKIPKTAGQRAQTNLRAARRGNQQSEWAGDERSKYLLKEASVLATLELADAIRSRQSA